MISQYQLDNGTTLAKATGLEFAACITSDDCMVMKSGKTVFDGPYDEAIDYMANYSTSGVRKNYVMLSDPGHGWLAVPIADIKSLGLTMQPVGEEYQMGTKRLTRFSYMKGAIAYLEEDCDYATFMQTAKEAGWGLSIIESFQEVTPIRTYQSLEL